MLVLLKLEVPMGVKGGVVSKFLCNENCSWIQDLWLQYKHIDIFYMYK